MKLQDLGIIFIIIIIPIILILSEYMNNRIHTANLELEYNTKLLNSTFDAIKAYQLNSVKNSYGDDTNQTVKDVRAATKTFYNSLASNFNLVGYKAEVMKEYVPAVVFTLYDGYYIHSPFINTLTEIDSDSFDEKYSKPNELTEGLKPYVFYSCRYKVNDDNDFSITYTLDNYITIQGLVNGKYVYDFGYIYSVDSVGGISKNGNTYKYDGIDFTENDTEELKEYVGNTEYSYVKINGVKYYLEEEEKEVKVIKYNGNNIQVNKKAKIFFIDKDGKKNYSQTPGYETDRDNFLRYYFAIKKNKSAYEYYKNAYEFSKAVMGSAVDGYKDKALNPTGGYNLSSLKTSNAIIYNISDTDIIPIKEYGEFKIFDANPQEPTSNFNNHRKAIIRYVIETNLSAAISGFSSKANTKFIMPKIKEEDWETIQNEVSVISFMQGINIGSRIYNGYAAVSNTLNKQYIDENDIYILRNDKTYYAVNDEKITDADFQFQLKDETNNYYPGIWKINFEQQQDISTGSSINYYPMSGYLGSYTSIFGNSGVKTDSKDIYNYIKNSTNVNLKEIYYKALGRERWEAFYFNNIDYEIYKSNSNEYFLKDYENFETE